MTNRAAGHGGGFDAIEFVAQFLPVLPFEEFGERHRLPYGEVHGDHCSTLLHWAFSPSSAGRREGTGCPCGLEGLGEAEASPVGTAQNGISESSTGGRRLSCASGPLSSPWFGPLHRRSIRSQASVTPQNVSPSFSHFVWPIEPEV